MGSWLCAFYDRYLFLTLLLDPSLHVNFGIEFINLISEEVSKLGPLGLQGRCQQAVLDGKLLGMQRDVSNLPGRNRTKADITEVQTYG